mgnify:FL=1
MMNKRDLITAEIKNQLASNDFLNRTWLVDAVWDTLYARLWSDVPCRS